MSDTSSIQWCDATLNAVIGCKRVSSGCDHCYAFELHDKRHIAWKRGRWDAAPAQYHLPFSRVQLMPERLEAPFRWRKPKRVFVNSMSDMWHDDVPDWFIARTWAMMALTPQHTYQILTKRPERMVRWFQSHPYQDVLREAGAFRAQRPRLGDIPISDPARFPLPNVWLGVSVENQQAADERIPLLLDTPAAVRFLSCEPLLGPVNLWDHYFSVIDRYGEPSLPRCDPDGSRAIKWVIIGGESGSHARPMQLEWVHDLLEQCDEAGVAAFVKQLGTVWASKWDPHPKRDRHGGTMDEWPEELRIRQFPQVVTA